MRRFIAEARASSTPIRAAAHFYVGQNNMSTIEEYLDHCYDKFFSAIVEKKNLKNLKKEIIGMAGMYEAQSKNFVIRLINDRGCVNYDLLSIHSPSCSCDGELIAEILDPRNEKERKHSIRRLSLEDQTRLFLDKWNMIDEMMNNKNVSITEKSLNILGIERSKIMFK